MPVEMYTEEEYDERFEEGQQYAIDNIEDFVSEIRTSGMDVISEYYAENSSQEWLDDAVVPCLHALNKEQLTELAQAVLEQLED